MVWLLKLNQCHIRCKWQDEKRELVHDVVDGRLKHGDVSSKAALCSCRFMNTAAARQVLMMLQTLSEHARWIQFFLSSCLSKYSLKLIFGVKSERIYAAFCTYDSRHIQCQSTAAAVEVEFRVKLQLGDGAVACIQLNRVNLVQSELSEVN
jgi:hypothetical protein